MNNYHINLNKINSKFLNSSKEIIVALPSTFHQNFDYEVYLVFDGKDMLLNQENNILLGNKSNCVFIGISSTNNMTRFND